MFVEQVEKAIEKNMISPAQFSMSLIQDSLHSNVNIIDTIVGYVEDNELDMEDVIPLLDQSIQERIRVCGVEERYVLGQKISKKKLF